MDFDIQKITDRQNPAQKTSNSVASAIFGPKYVDTVLHDDAMEICREGPLGKSDESPDRNKSMAKSPTIMSAINIR